MVLSPCLPQKFNGSCWMNSKPLSQQLKRSISRFRPSNRGLNPRQSLFIVAADDAPLPDCAPMRTAPLLLVIALYLVGCAGISDKSTSNADAAFARLADEFIKGQLDWRPSMGTSLGLHEYDGRVTDLSPA